MRSVATILMFSVVTACRAQTELRQEAELSAAQVESEVLALLADGKQPDAEATLESYASIYSKNQRVLFLHACLLRSRFDVASSLPLFKIAADLDRKTKVGQCAAEMAHLDSGDDVNKHFNALRTLAVNNNHPDPIDVMVRWMFAVQCRTLKKAEEGAAHYSVILQKWHPGPVMVHQTYGNLLEDLGRYKEALVERRIAVEMEPAGWSYQGLGSTLANLGQFEEANVAFTKSIERDPDNARYWTSWAWGLAFEKRLTESIAKCEKAISLNPTESRAWGCWGLCLEQQGQLTESIVKYKRALELDPSYDYASKRIEAVEKKLQ